MSTEKHQAGRDPIEQGNTEKQVLLLGVQDPGDHGRQEARAATEKRGTPPPPRLITTRLPKVKTMIFIRRYKYTNVYVKPK